MPFATRLHSHSILSLTFAGCLLFSGSFACSESGDGPLTSTGGSASGGSASGGSGTGGAIATGGAVATGGTSSGGSTATGGGSTGGDQGSGGVQNTGGADATGGAASGGNGAGATGSGGELGAGGDQGSGGTQGTWSPCPETGACKILPLGDSITFGLDGSGGGYRVELFRLATEAGHEITFTGTQSPNGPDMVAGVPFPRNHAGISGQLIAEIAGRIPNPDMQEVPHIVLLHAGTNDIFRASDGAADRLGDLMDKLVQQAPDALIVVSNIIPLVGAAGTVSAFNAQVEPMVQARADDGAHILFVDQFEGFPEGELVQGVHPNDTGYARMGAKWYEAIESYLP